LNKAEEFIKARLAERQATGAYRALKPESGLVDFCSNDYMGFARSSALKKLIDEEIQANKGSLNGSTGSRLLSGNTAYAEKLEQDIAAYHQSETGLMYNSGYDANVGLFSSLPQKGDTIIMDELAHASIIDGARLSFANRYNFRHNDLESLEEKLKHAKGNCYVVVESVYSMDGDTSPLREILELTELYSASLIVDEAHAVGIYKKGVVCKLGLESRVFARVVTFGKALGCHGAIVLGSTLLRPYLINFSRSFIYTTAAPFHQLASVKMAYELLGSADDEIEKLKDNIILFKKLLSRNRYFTLLTSDSAIQCVILGDNNKAREVGTKLRNAGLDVRPILSPTVPQGTERLRICLHAFNTIDEITLLADMLTKYNYAG
jgi:8-amino-7-oxononanoate synthase